MLRDMQIHAKKTKMNIYFPFLSYLVRINKFAKLISQNSFMHSVYNRFHMQPQPCDVYDEENRKICWTQIKYFSSFVLFVSIARLPLSLSPSLSLSFFGSRSPGMSFSQENFMQRKVCSNFHWKNGANRIHKNENAVKREIWLFLVHPFSFALPLRSVKECECDAHYYYV